MTALSIRAYAPADFDRLDAIRAEAFAPIFASFRALLGADIAAIALRDAEREQRALLESFCAGAAQVFVAEREDRIIGFVCVTLDRTQGVGEIALDAVAPEAAGRGAGSALIAHALAFMRAEGMRAAVVGVGGDDSHAPARRAYEKAGFRAGIPSLHLYRAL